MVETGRRRGRGRRRRGAHRDTDQVGLRAAGARGARVRLLRVRAGHHNEQHGALAEHALQFAQFGQLLRTTVTEEVYTRSRYWKH